jgi:hypothetical protein
MRNVVAGNLFRLFHIKTADELGRLLVNSATAFGPPSSAITSPTVSRSFVMLRNPLSRHVIAVKHHDTELDLSQDVYKLTGMPQNTGYPFEDQGRRLRLLREAEQIPSGLGLSRKLGWTQSAVSQFEIGARQVPGPKALELKKAFPGFDPVWLWTGDKTHLGFDLRKRIEALEEKDPRSASSKR